MVGGRELESELELPDAFHLSSLSVVATLNYVGSPGHIFFCNLCLAPCYNDTELYDHLIDKPHTEKLAIAKITLLKSNPWPFSDCLNFFSNSPEQEYKPLPFPNTDLGLLIVGDALMSTKIVPNELDSNGFGLDCDLVIHTILYKDNKITDLGLRFMGFGIIGTRVLENDKGTNEIKKIWCEWLGKKAKDDDEDIRIVEQHDFAVIVFAYFDNLGRNLLIRKPKKSQSPKSTFSSSSSSSSSSRSLLDGIDENQFFLQSRLTEMFKQRRLSAGEGLCCICKLKMLPDTDVAALLNTKTGNLSCCRCNHLEYHVFHISCLIHWILMCEFAIWTKKSSGAEVKLNSKRKRSTKSSEKKQISCVFCPECRGTGINTNDLEKPTVPLSKVVEYKSELTDAGKRWINSPEELQNCSTGLLFASKSEETVQEKLLPLKLLRFYRVNE